MNENLTNMIQEQEERLESPIETLTNNQPEILSFDDIEMNLEPPASLKETRDLQESNVPVPVNDETKIIQVNEAQFDTEADLIQHTREVFQRTNVVNVLSYWEIGHSINSFYKGKYGSKELDRIAEATGVGRDTLAKMCGFAKKYDHEQVQILIQSHFLIPWNRIAQNLTIPSERFIETLQKSETPDQFHNGIIKLKNPGERRGKSRLPRSVEPEVIDIQPERMAPEDTEAPLPDDYPAADDQDQEEINEQYRAYEKELKDLRDEIARLTQEGIKKDQRIKALEKELSDTNRDLDQQYDRADRVEKKIDGVIEIINDGGGLVDIMRWLESDG
ncbi:MAG: hypothetical protein CVU61_14460 [Deltaproteobacteria bacterium HGW-Deltaproteobacteria-19]|nr:MAG: hypothetical protein CVU61_14460 [Deltaproteobacteria bacterium HGW-Deltaproteobacteria-19]